MHFPVSDDYKKHKLLSVDPGSMSTGIAIFSLDDITITSIEAFTIQPARSLIKIGKLDEDRTERNTRILILKEIFSRILTETRPSMVACESPFYNPRMPGAYGALVEVLSHLRTATHEMNPVTNFFTIEPTLVKKGVGAKSIAGKMDMRTALRVHPEIYNKLTVDLEELDEHGVDAIAVGYSWYKYALEGSKW